MPNDWETVTLETEAEIIQVLDLLQGTRWLCRGHSRLRGVLVPSIDRPPRNCLSRIEKLRYEREAIDLFRSTARFFASPGEEEALRDHFVALAVLRHYGVPTRLLDWTRSPFVAGFFAVSTHDAEDGELWAFDESEYERAGKAQWLRHPETTTDGSGSDVRFDANLTAFMSDEPPDWFVVMTYPAGFPRQNAQSAAYTITARFGVDHALAVSRLFSPDRFRCRRYVIRAEVKAAMREFLRNRHGIWRGALFPDSAGAAETARSALDGPGA